MDQTLALGEFCAQVSGLAGFLCAILVARRRGLSGGLEVALYVVALIVGSIGFIAMITAALS